MRVAVITRLLSNQGGGIPTAILRLYENLAAAGLDIVLIAGDEPGSVASNVRVVPYKSVGPASFSFSPDLLDILHKENPDVVHLHGLWTYASIASQLWKRRTQGPLVVSPHGMVDKWALSHHGLRKKIAGTLFEWRNLKNATCIHAVSEGELQALRDLGFSNRVVKIPNGVEVPSEMAISAGSCSNQLLYLGRLHPKKGLLEVIKAWSIVSNKLKAEGTSWRLVIAGWDEGGYVEKLHRAVEQYDLKSEVEFVGPVFGNAKDAAYTNASAVILASYSEGLPMSVLEAWAFAKPVFITNDCNLPEGFKAGAAFEITTDPDCIAKVLLSKLRCREELNRAGRAGRDLAKRVFDWGSISNQWQELYASLVRKRLT